MNYLIINTASINSQICLAINDKVIIENLCDSHSEHLLPAIDKILGENNLNVKDINCFGINVGPGSFTGIRIGVSTIKAFLVATNAKCISFNSFDILSYNIKENNYIVMFNSGNNDYYYAVYKSGICETQSVGSLEEISNLSKQLNLTIYATEANDNFGNYNIQLIDVSSDSIYQIAKKKFEENQVVEINQLCPIYIKRSQAENFYEEKIAKGLKIEKCKDYKSLLAIEKECFEDAWCEQSFVEEFEQTDRLYYEAKVDNEVVGYIGVWKTGDDYNLLKLAVLPRYRKFGIATKLVSLVKNSMQENNINEFFLEVDSENIPAINLYTKLGFETKHIRKKYYKNGNDCLMMFLNKDKELCEK